MIKITLTGLGIVLVNFLTLLYYDPLYLTNKDVTNGTTTAIGPPQWVYFTCVLFENNSGEDCFLMGFFFLLYSWAAGLFLYQSLDAIDG